MLTGRRLGVYHIHEQIGAGGMGEVYRARDTRLGRDVAIRLDEQGAMRTFDITPDGTRIVFDRLRDNSDIVLIDLERPQQRPE